jgi:hypothetical protein
MGQAIFCLRSITCEIEVASVHFKRLEPPVKWALGAGADRRIPVMNDAQPRSRPDLRRNKFHNAVIRDSVSKSKLGKAANWTRRLDSKPAFKPTIIRSAAPQW